MFYVSNCIELILSIRIYTIVGQCCWINKMKLRTKNNKKPQKKEKKMLQKAVESQVVNWRRP